MFYDYACEKCKVIKEVRHGMTEEPEILCDECGEKMSRIISGGSGVHYKGQGWPRKGTGTASKPKHYKEVGIKVDNDLKNEMKEAGEL